MALKPTLETLEGLDESLAAHYSETEEGGYILEVEKAGGYELANTTKLKKALERERAKAKANEDKWGDLTPDEAKELAAEVESLREKIASGKSTDEDALAQVRAEMKKKHQEQAASWEKQKTELERDLFEIAARSKAREALRQGGFTEAEELLLPHVEKHLRMVRDAQSGRRELHVINPEDGSRRIGDADGSWMGVEGLIAELKEDSRFSRFADGTRATGGGLESGETERVAPAPTDLNLDPTEMLARHWDKAASGA